MEPKTPKLLQDICDASRFVREVTSGKTLDDYRADRLLRQAVERNFEIIGEAIGRLARIDPATADKIDDFSQIISFRNVLIHGYDLIDEMQVWKVIQSSLPTLESQASSLLGDVTGE